MTLGHRQTVCEAWPGLQTGLRAAGHPSKTACNQSVMRSACTYVSCVIA